MQTVGTALKLKKLRSAARERVRKNNNSAVSLDATRCAFIAVQIPMLEALPKAMAVRCVRCVRALRALRACVRACVRACRLAYVRACMRARMLACDSRFGVRANHDDDDDDDHDDANEADDHDDHDDDAAS